MIKKIYLLFLLVIYLRAGFAQDEMLVPLGSNPVLKNFWKNVNANASEKIQSAGDTLLLPFTDDFSLPGVFPRSDLWLDSSVFINTDFPKNPPTIGVATFEGLNKYGNPYNNTNANATGFADTLTSKPIKTYDDVMGNVYNPADGLFLSFFYEQKGNGDRPESSDSFRLEFCDSTGFWNFYWSINGVSGGIKDTTFTRIQLTVTDPKYFYKGFRFRFRNNGSLTGNVDHWHLDYVSLRPPPNFSDINDVAYVYPGNSLLNGLTAMPYTHYKAIVPPSSVMLDNATYKMHNNYSLDKICRFVDEIFDPSGNQVFCNGCCIGCNNFQVNSNSSIPYNFPFTTFEYPVIATQDSAVFDVKNHIESTSGGPLDDNAQNDTIHYYQNFINYYAHDDGTAELGYSLTGAGAQLAYKFHVYKSDTLRAIQFYFTQIGTSVANELFRIMVWNSSGGIPGAIEYQKPNQTPNYTNMIDGYYTYTTSPTLLPAGDHFFGFIQTNNTLFNLGFDVNIATPPSNKYYNTSGTWNQSTTPPGSWMIRPVFSSSPLNVSVNEIPSLNELSVYPNPASTVLNVDYDTKGIQFNYEFTDATGRLTVSNRLLNNRIDVSAFANGFYVIKIFDSGRNNIFQQKVIVQH